MGAKRNFSNVIIHALREFTALLCVALLVPGNAVAVQTQQPALHPATCGSSRATSGKATAGPTGFVSGADRSLP